jgi:hypothetical protein
MENLQLKFVRVIGFSTVCVFRRKYREYTRQRFSAFTFSPHVGNAFPGGLSTRRTEQNIRTVYRQNNYRECAFGSDRRNKGQKFGT